RRSDRRKFRRPRQGSRGRQALAICGQIRLQGTHPVAHGQALGPGWRRGKRSALAVAGGRGWGRGRGRPPGAPDGCGRSPGGGREARAEVSGTTALKSEPEQKLSPAEQLEQQHLALAKADARAVAAEKRAQAKARGYEGEACGECGNFTLVRNGTCLKCDTCGGTTGCS